MAWSWSHTNEAYDNAYNNLCRLSVDELRVIYAEWKAYFAGKETDPDDDEPFDNDACNAALEECKDFPDDVLADQIWGWASEGATCDNGGFKAWVCPYGCHTVSFDSEENDEEE